MTQYTIGVDIGGTKTSVGLVSEQGIVPGALLTERTPASDGPEEIVGLVARMVHAIGTAQLSNYAMGVGTAGVVTAEGTIRSATDAIVNWQGFTLRESLMQVLDRPVFVLNDVHAAAVGEAKLGAGRESDAFLMITIGTGVGGATSRGGLPDFGATGTAGSIGHTAARNQEQRLCPCGQFGHVEAYASGPAMECAYTQATGRSLDLRQIVGRARGDGGHAPDKIAQEIVRSGAVALGTGLADALNLIDCDLVILGGGVAAIEGYRDMVEQAFVAAALPGPSEAVISAAQLGTEATLVGAGLYAAHRISPR